MDIARSSAPYTAQASSRASVTEGWEVMAGYLEYDRAGASRNCSSTAFEPASYSTLKVGPYRYFDAPRRTEEEFARVARIGPQAIGLVRNISPANA